METFKILKFHYPIPLYLSYNISKRKQISLILSLPSKNFIYRSSVLWNVVANKLKIKDYSESVSSVRSRLKQLLLALQHRELPLSWSSEDYNITKLNI